MPDAITGASNSKALSKSAPFWRRLLAVVYDLLSAGILILIIVNLIIYSIAVYNTGGFKVEKEAFSVEPGSLLANLLLAIKLGLGCLYYWFFWQYNGQTLGMRVWKIKLEQADNQQLVSHSTAILRYWLALLSWFCAGVGILWMFFDKDKQALHDKLLNTRVVISNNPLLPS